MEKQVTASDIKKLVAADNVVIGTDETIENLKLGKVQTVVVSSNCPESVVEDINHYAKLSEAEVVVTQYPNEELGVICKKPFSISVLSITSL